MHKYLANKVGSNFDEQETVEMLWTLLEIHSRMMRHDGRTAQRWANWHRTKKTYLTAVKEDKYEDTSHSSDFLQGVARLCLTDLLYGVCVCLMQPPKLRAILFKLLFWNLPLIELEILKRVVGNGKREIRG